jgi:hypothetical protein
MSKLWLTLLFMPVALGTTLTGTLNLPNGVGASGTLTLALSQPGALSASGGCGGPIQIVPTYQFRITVTNGALVGSPSVYSNGCILPQGTFYYVQFFDTSGNLIFSDQWLISGTTMDIGTVVSVIISGTTQILGGVGVVLTSPTGSQTITQQPGTQMIFAASGTGFTPYYFTAPVLFPDLSSCLSSGCVFNSTPFFLNGLNTGYVNSSIMWIGSSGALYPRTTTGADFSCTAGVPSGTPPGSGDLVGNDGFLGIRLDTHSLEFCYGGHLYGVAATQIY